MLVYKTYVCSVAVGTLLLVFFTCSINVLVDPYAVFGTPRMAGFNELKPYAGDHGRVGKLYQALRVAPKGLIVGNSRPEMGLSPDNPCWPTMAHPVYNTALPGLSVYQQVRYAQHAQAAGLMRAMLVGVDFLDFLYKKPPPKNPHSWPPTNVDPAAEKFEVDPNGHLTNEFLWVRLTDYLKAAASLDAFVDSLMTIARQEGTFVPTRTPAGFNPAEGIYIPIVRNEGPRVLFEQKDSELADRLRGTKWRLFGRNEDWSANFEALRRLIQQSAAADTKMVIFINPYHAEYLLLIDAAGLWPLFEMWKRRLAQLARAEGVDLWDFSGFDRYSTESVDALPARGTSLDWFWEPAHYRRELGDLMLANIWRTHCPPDWADSPHYGVRLNGHGDAAAQLDAHLAAQRAARDAYKAAHLRVVQRIRQLFSQKP